MTEIGTPEGSSGPLKVKQPATVTLTRLVRLRRDDESHQPSRIYAQIIGQHPGGEVSALGHAELFHNDEHVPLASEAWSAGEAVLEALHTKEIRLDDPRQVRDLVEDLSQTAEYAAKRSLTEYSQAAFDAVFRAIKEAFLVFCNSGPAGETVDELGTLLDRNMSSVTRYFVSPAPAAPSYQGAPANAFQDAPYIEPLPKDGTKGHLLEREALRYGMASTRYPNGAFVVTDPVSEKQMAFKWGRSPLASGVALSICSYKEATRRLLKRVDVPVPKGRVFSTADWDLAVEYADRIGYPVVCKPVAGLRGIGVVANIQNRTELESALKLYRQSELGDDDFVIEEHVPGEDYRIVVIGDQVVASVVRAPASVTGDGQHTIADLIEYKNRARRENPHLSSRLIKINDSVEYQLRLRNLSFSSVPTPGQVVTLANSANLSQGGDSFEIADEMHPSIKELSVKAVQAIPGLGFCGLDMLIEDHTKPIWEQRVTVIELNAHAAIGSAQYPMWGEPAPVAKKFFEVTSAHNNIALPQAPSDELTLKLTVRGRVSRGRYKDWFRRRAENFGLDGYVKRSGTNRVEAIVSGKADAVSALGYLAMQGPKRAIPTSVTMEPTAWDEPHHGFKVVADSAAGSVTILLRRVFFGLRRRAKKVFAP